MADDTSNLSSMVQEIIADGKLTRDEKRRIDDALMADGQITLDERKMIDELLALIGSGKLELVD